MCKRDFFVTVVVMYIMVNLHHAVRHRIYSAHVFRISSGSIRRSIDGAIFSAYSTLFLMVLIYSAA